MNTITKDYAFKPVALPDLKQQQWIPRKNDMRIVLQALDDLVAGVIDLHAFNRARRIVVDAVKGCQDD